MPISYSAVGSRTQTASATTLTASAPLTTVSVNSRIGGVFVVVVSIKAVTTATTATSGWTKVREDTLGGYTQVIFLAPWNVAASPVITWSGASSAATISFYVENTFEYMSSTEVGAVSAITGSLSPVTDPGITSLRNSSIAAIFTYSGVNTAIGASSGWTEIFDGGSATDIGRTSIQLRDFSQTAGSVTGSISYTIGSATYITQVVELQVQSPGINNLQPTGFDSLEQETVVWADGEGTSISEVEIVTWLNGAAGNEMSELEIVSWLAPIPPSNRRRQFNVN